MGEECMREHCDKQHQMSIEKTCCSRDVSVFEMLNVSRQVSETELARAYDAEREKLNQLCPESDSERMLVQRKVQMLDEAYAQQLTEQKQSDPIGRLETAYAQSRRRNGYVLHGFNIPCIFWLSFKVLDIPWNFCCADCSCLEIGGCGDEDCCSECYEDCDLFRQADTVIAIGAIVAAVIYGLLRLFQMNKTQRESVRIERRERSFQEYCERVEETCERWDRLAYYDSSTTIAFLDAIGQMSTDPETDQQYEKMMQHVERLVLDIERQKDDLVKEVQQLRSDERFDRMMQGNRLKYTPMFRDAAERAAAIEEGGN